MKLQTAFIKDKDLSSRLVEDIDEMEKMLTSIFNLQAPYLEKDELFDLVSQLTNY